mgnify:FL=1
MPTARKDVADRLNDAAMSAAKTLISISNGEVETGVAQVRLAAAKTILAKVIPDLRAVEAKIDANVTMQDFIIGGPEDTSNT